MLIRDRSCQYHLHNQIQCLQLDSMKADCKHRVTDFGKKPVIEIPDEIEQIATNRQGSEICHMNRNPKMDNDIRA